MLLEKIRTDKGETIQAKVLTERDNKTNHPVYYGYIVCKNEGNGCEYWYSDLSTVPVRLTRRDALIDACNLLTEYVDQNKNI